MHLKREDLQGLIEPFIFDELKKTQYSTTNIPALKLLSWNRLDLAFKLLYLDLKDKNPKLANRIYQHDIRSQTLGNYKERGNMEKSDFNEYIKTFDEIHTSLKPNGFNPKVSLIPLSTNGTIINGAHRTAAAIHVQQTVSCVETELPSLTCNFSYFFDRGVPSPVLDFVTNSFIDYSNNVYLAFLWPSGKANAAASRSIFKDVVYSKNLTLTPKGGFNLIVELYKHMDWIGSNKSGFSGAKQKFAECFPSLEKVTVIAFQASSIEEVQKIKLEIRETNKIGFSSIHITDTKEEAARISKLIFNDNGIHFLNYGNPHRFFRKRSIEGIKVSLTQQGIAPEGAVLDGSIVLSLYGIRQHQDIDILTETEWSKQNSDVEFDAHDSELLFHKLEKQDLIYDPLNYFEYEGLKFISFHQLYAMKTNRNELKDRSDLKHMLKMNPIDNRRQIIPTQAQKFFYLNLKVRRWIKDKLILILNFLGIYKPVRSLYRHFIGRVK